MTLLLFCFTATATTEIYTLSLHDALPIFSAQCSSLTPDVPLTTRTPAAIAAWIKVGAASACVTSTMISAPTDRKSTRLNSSHQIISYAVFCLKKKNKKKKQYYNYSYDNST